jgi:hypothetical protein
MDQNIETLKVDLKNKSETLVLYGAGLMGKISLYFLRKNNIKVDFFCDSDIRRKGENVDGLEVISPNDLKKFDRNINILVSNKYLSSVYSLLKENNFINIRDCSEIISKTNLDEFYDDESISLEIKGGRGDFPILKLKREAEFYVEMCKKEKYLSSNYLHIKSVDIQITERCSAKCKNCSNLMQYYKKPAHTDFDNLFESVDNFMNAIDELDEFRVIGGDAFMHKELHKVIKKLDQFDSRIIIYTNAKIIPKGKNLEALKNPKIIVDITNYGNEASLAHDNLIKVLKDEKIDYSTNLCTEWQDSGRILPFQNKNEIQLNHDFDNCCNNELISILHGKLYRCPFSANATNLKAIPEEESDIVNLNKSNNKNSEIRNEIYNLCYNKKSLSACNYCNGRDYTTKWIKAAEQTKKPLEYKEYN